MQNIINIMTKIAEHSAANEEERKRKLEKSLARTNSLLARYTDRVKGGDQGKLRAALAEVDKVYPDFKWGDDNRYSNRAIAYAGDYRLLVYWMSGGGVKVHVQNKFVDCLIVTYGAKLKVQDLRLDASLHLGKGV